MYKNSLKECGHIINNIMSLEYYLFVRQKYDEIISNLDYIIEAHEQIEYYISNENDITTIPKELFNYESDIFFKTKKQKIIKCKQICDAIIKSLCKHEFEDDVIDITPEKSQNICYCKICGYSK